MMPPRAASVDPRSVRVQKSLKRAVLALLRERRIETLAVGEIADRASVSRQVFYQHFRDRDDVAAVAMIDTIHAAVFVDADSDPVRRIHRLLDVAIASEGLCRNLRPSAASERLADYFQELLRDMAGPIAQARAQHGPPAHEACRRERVQAHTLFLAGGLGEVIKFAVDCSGESDILSEDVAHRMVDHCLEMLPQ